MTFFFQLILFLFSLGRLFLICFQYADQCCGIFDHVIISLTSFLIFFICYAVFSLYTYLYIYIYIYIYIYFTKSFSSWLHWSVCLVVFFFNVNRTKEKRIRICIIREIEVWSIKKIVIRYPNPALVKTWTRRLFHVLQYTVVSRLDYESMYWIITITRYV